MRDKKRSSKHNLASDDGEELQILSDEELFEDVEDYDETEEVEEELSEETDEMEPDEISAEDELEDKDDHDEDGYDDEDDYDEEGYEEEELPESSLEEDVLEEEETISKEESLDDEEELSEMDILLKKKRRKKRVRIAFLSILGVIVAAYLGVSGYFYSHFYLNTKINGTGVSMYTVAQVQKYMESQVEDYKLVLKESDGDTEEIDGTDISLEYVKDDSVKKLLEKQNPLLWVTALWKTPEIEASVGVSYDEEKLNKVIENLTCMKEEEQKLSVNAHPEFKDTQFEIVEEQIGTDIDEEKFVKAVNEAISGFRPELDMKAEGCYILPKYTKDSPEVAEARDAMNSYLGADITLDFTPYTEKVDSSVISQWIAVDDNMQVTFKQESVRAYITSLAEKYDTYGKPRTFTTGFGNTVQVEGGNYGWQIDQEAEYAALTANIQNAEVITREPSYARRAVTHEGNDFGNTYAEVDLTNQHMFYFKDGQCLLETDVVTGNPNRGNGTPQGVYTLAYKAPNQVLRGPKKEDGTYEWESPVSYWMPFNGGIGFHDANWQSAFGGSRYLTYGSHGCVNMPPQKAGELYNLIEAGTPVVCHY